MEVGTHWTAAHVPGRLCTSRCDCVCLCLCGFMDLCPCWLCVHVHYRLWGCAPQCKIVQDCTCLFHLLCVTGGNLCPCTGLCLCLCEAVQCPREAVHTHVGLSGPAQACGLCKPRCSCACLCRVVYAHMGLWQPVGGYVHPGEACVAAQQLYVTQGPLLQPEHPQISRNTLCIPGIPKGCAGSSPVTHLHSHLHLKADLCSLIDVMCFCISVPHR